MKESTLHVLMYASKRAARLRARAEATRSVGAKMSAPGLYRYSKGGWKNATKVV